MFGIFIFCCTTSYSTYVHLFVINLLTYLHTAEIPLPTHAITTFNYYSMQTRPPNFSPKQSHTCTQHKIEHFSYYMTIFTFYD